MNYEEMSVSQLGELAKELGVFPEDGSGKDGKVVKKDLLSALKIGVKATFDALPSQQKYKLDTQYRVVKEGLSNHPVGAIVLNLPRSLGIMAVEEGFIEELPGAPKVSNPRARIIKEG
jgi:hypothetical protein